MSTAHARAWTFSVEGMHCVGCIRKIQQAGSDLKDLKVDFSTNTVRAYSDENYDPHPFIERINDLGFSIKVIPNAEDAVNKKKSKSFLARVGISGACAGNIMLISVASYSGADQSEFATLLNWLSFLFFLPVFFYGAWPFFENSLTAFKHRKISVDIPIALAIFGGSVISFFNLLRDHQALYFDSISMFIFFLLASRYLIFKIQNRHLHPITIDDVYSQPMALRVNNNSEERVEISKLNEGDHIILNRGEFVPVDAKVLSDSAEVNNAFFNGEVFPQKLQKFDRIFAGAKIVSPQALVEVIKPASESRISGLVEKLNQALIAKTPITNLTDKGAHYLTLGVLTVASLFFAYYSFIDWQEGLNRVLALLVVACPCGLAIATPLAQSLSVKKALKKSVLVKKAEALENLRDCNIAVFDKTGTLTSGALAVKEWLPREPEDLEKQIITQLEKNSEHPVAKALLRDCFTHSDIEMSHIREVVGIGVSGKHDGNVYELRNNSKEGQHSVGFYKEEELILTAVLQDEVLDSTRPTLDSLRDAGIDVHLLSGDKDTIAQSVGQDLGFSNEKIIAEATPEKKLQVIERLNKEGKVLYIGDGVNDALAMSHAHVSTSMHSAADATFRASDLHLLQGNLQTLLELIDLAKKTVKTIKHNIVLSAVYNITFAGLALAGLINPLIAVILMPVSSLTVTGYTVYRLGRSA